jgi:sugar phosphate isomerase/epimerase
MSKITRRDAGKLIAGGTAGWLAGSKLALSENMIDSVVRGVQIGAQSYSFRDMPLDRCIEAYRDIGLGECELFAGHVEPKDVSGEQLREWRMNTPVRHFHRIREKFDNAKILLYAYNYSFTKSMTNGEFERGFQIAHSLGVRYITASSQVSTASRVDEYAKKYQITVGLHGHDNTQDPDELSTPDTFARAMQGASQFIGINLDIGHFTAAGGDAVAFLLQQHNRIVTLHIKDRKKNHGENTRFGQGDAPIIAVLRLLRENRWRIPANIEYEYGNEIKGLDTVTEVRKCYEYCRRALES